MTIGYRIAVLIAVLASIVAVGTAVWTAQKVVHECHKQCDFGDKRCADMCGARHFCPAHPDGI